MMKLAIRHVKGAAAGVMILFCRYWGRQWGRDWRGFTETCLLCQGGMHAATAAACDMVLQLIGRDSDSDGPRVALHAQLQTYLLVRRLLPYVLTKGVQGGNDVRGSCELGVQLGE
jgi:hypothetical protein